MIRKTLIFCLIGLVIVLQSSAIAATEKSSASINGITQAAVQAGVLTCSSRINQIATFLTKDSKSGAFLFLPSGDQPDKQTFSASIEMDPAGAPAMYASATFTPNITNGCTASYDTVEYVNNSCANVEEEVFKGKKTGMLKKDIAVISVDNIKFFLMPAGKGCVVIKKEVLS